MAQPWMFSDKGTRRIMVETCTRSLCAWPPERKVISTGVAKAR